MLGMKLSLVQTKSVQPSMKLRIIQINFVLIFMKRKLILGFRKLSYTFRGKVKTQCTFIIHFGNCLLQVVEVEIAAEPVQYTLQGLCGYESTLGLVHHGESLPQH